jgi:signal transduction histidine kinase
VRSRALRSATGGTVGRALRNTLRWRITISFLGASLAVSALVAGTTFFLAERYLYGQRIEDAVQQSTSNVGFAVRYLGDDEDADTLAELVSLLESRGGTDVLVVRNQQVFPSSVSVASLRSVPSELLAAVASGRVAYAYRDSPHQLVVGSPIPGRDLRTFFFYPIGDLEETLAILGRVLLGVAVGAVAIAALAGTRVSARVAHPVRRASRAARRVAEGLLETRLPVTGRDEFANLAASFNEMAAALEERIARERRFVGDVSHELRTPLTTLRTSTDYLLEHAAELPPSLHRAAELLAADLEYLQRLVDDLLDLSRVEAGRVDMSWEPISLEDLAREVVARRTRHGGERVEVLVEAPAAELVTVADKQRLERVVGNLVDNALLHGQGAEVKLRLDADDGSLLLSVEDRGPGISPDASRRIFERFYKGDPSRTRGGGRGSGLGLAIARENASLHGGEIHVYAGRDRGARFTLRLPRRDPAPEGDE